MTDPDLHAQQRARLQALFEAYGVTPQQAARLIGASPSNMRAWLAPPEAPWKRRIRQQTEDYLRLKLELYARAARARGQQAAPPDPDSGQ